MSLTARMLHTRWVVRAPIVLFRARLGFLFGGRFLMLEHVGRSSGQARFVVLECVERAAADRVMVASGFGEGSQWLRNLRATPACHVSIGRTYRASAMARELPRAQADEVLDRYRRDHPSAYKELAGVIAESTDITIDESPIVELTLAR